MTAVVGELDWVIDLVRRESAIELDRTKQYLVEARLGPLARAAGHADLDGFVRWARVSGGVEAQRRIVEALTTNETSWFRDRAPFDALEHHIVPELLKTRRTALTPLRVWSAACSTGQEAYSIAMVLQAIRTPAAVPFTITGSDLSREVLEQARAGRYSQVEVNRGLPVTRLVSSFERDGAHWRVCESLRASCTWEQRNLTRPLVGLPRFDVVFLRNVLIYFSMTTRRSVLDQVRRVMAPGGFLVLGGAETTLGVDDHWRRETVGRGIVHRLVP